MILPYTLPLKDKDKICMLLFYHSEKHNKCEYFQTICPKKVEQNVLPVPSHLQSSK